MMISLNDRKISGIAIGIDFTLAADEEGNVFVWGKKEPVQRIVGPSSKMARSTSTFASTTSVETEKPVKKCRDRTLARKLKKKDIGCLPSNTKSVNTEEIACALHIPLFLINSFLHVVIRCTSQLFIQSPCSSSSSAGLSAPSDPSTTAHFPTGFSNTRSKLRFSPSSLPRFGTYIARRAS